MKGRGRGRECEGEEKVRERGCSKEMKEEGDEGDGGRTDLGRGGGCVHRLV